MLPNSGDILGEYRLEQLLGQGGCAAVFEAEHQRLARRVAVKVVLPDVAESVPGMAERFLREIDVAKRIEHPNVVRLYDFGETDDGLLWMAMELVRGRELEDVIRDEGPLDPERAKRLMLQVLAGLAQAHGQQIVHRDIKPGNIMLAESAVEGEVAKLLDFGIGKALGAEEDSAVQEVTEKFGQSFSSPHYMAPEQLKRIDVGPHSDVYACGLILAEMLSGKRAFEADSLFEVYAKQAFEELELPAWLKGSSLATVIERATTKDHTQRYPDAAAFHEALTGATTEATPMQRAGVGSTGPTSRWSRRVVAGLALAALAAAIAAWVMLG